VVAVVANTPRPEQGICSVLIEYDASCGLIPPMHTTVFTQCQSSLERAWNSIFARVFKGAQGGQTLVLQSGRIICLDHRLRSSEPPTAYLPERNDRFEMGSLRSISGAPLHSSLLDIMSTSESRQSFKTTSEILAYIRECYVEKQQEKDPYLSSVDWDCVLETGIYREERDAELNE
jgi:hypothetical protein